MEAELGPSALHRQNAFPEESGAEQCKEFTCSKEGLKHDLQEINDQYDL